MNHRIKPCKHWTTSCRGALGKTICDTSCKDYEMKEVDKMKLEKYLADNHPSILEGYKRYLTRDELPEVGDLVKTLIWGFGGPDGVIRKVIKVDGVGITVTDGNREYYSKIETWYNDLVVYKKKEVKK